jgi:hypothetical protein
MPGHRLFEIVCFEANQQLDDEDKQIIFRLIEKMLTNKSFKGFFQKNVTVDKYQYPFYDSLIFFGCIVLQLHNALFRRYARQTTY